MTLLGRFQVQPVFYWGQLHCFKRINYITVIWKQNKTQKPFAAEYASLWHWKSRRQPWVTGLRFLIVCTDSTLFPAWGAAVPGTLAPCPAGACLGAHSGLKLLEWVWFPLLLRGSGLQTLWEAQNGKVKPVHLDWMKINWEKICEDYYACAKCTDLYSPLYRMKLWAQCSLSLNVFVSLYHHLVHFIW